MRRSWEHREQSEIAPGDRRSHSDEERRQSPIPIPHLTGKRDAALNSPGLFGAAYP